MPQSSSGGPVLAPVIPHVASAKPASKHSPIYQWKSPYFSGSHPDEHSTTTPVIPPVIPPAIPSTPYPHPKAQLQHPRPIKAAGVGKPSWLKGYKRRELFARALANILVSQGTNVGLVERDEPRYL